MILKSMVPENLVLVCGLVIRRAGACVLVTAEGSPAEVQAQLLGVFRLGEVLEAREDGFSCVMLQKGREAPPREEQVEAVCRDYLRGKAWTAGKPKYLGSLNRKPGVAVYELRVRQK